MMNQNGHRVETLCTKLHLHPRQSMRMLRHALESSNLDHALCFAFDLLNVNYSSYVWRELMLTVFHTGMPFFHRDLPELLHSFWTTRKGNGAVADGRDEIQLIFSAVRFVALLPKTPLTAAIGLITAFSSNGAVPEDVSSSVVPDLLSRSFPVIKDDLIRSIATCFVQNVHDCCVDEYSEFRELLAVQCAMQLVMRGYSKMLWETLINEVLASSIEGLRAHMTTFSSWMTIYRNVAGPHHPDVIDSSLWNRTRNIIITTIAIMVRRFGKPFHPAKDIIPLGEDLSLEEINAIGMKTLADMALPARYFIPHRKAAAIADVVRTARETRKLHEKMVPEIFSVRRSELEMLFDANGIVDVARFMMGRFLPPPAQEVYDKSDALHPTASGFHEIMTRLSHTCRSKIAVAGYSLSVRAWTAKNVRLTASSAIVIGQSYGTMLDMAASTMPRLVRDGPGSLTTSSVIVDVQVDPLSNAPFWCRALPFLDWAERKQVPDDARGVIPEGGNEPFLVGLHVENFRFAMARDEIVQERFQVRFRSDQQFIVFHMGSQTAATAYVAGLAKRHALIRMLDPDGVFLRCMVPISIRSVVMVSYDPQPYSCVSVPADILPQFSPVPFALLCVLSRACDWPVRASDLRWSENRETCFIAPTPASLKQEAPRSIWKSDNIPMLTELASIVDRIVFDINQHGMTAEARNLRDLRAFTQWAQDPGNASQMLEQLNKHII